MVKATSIRCAKCGREVFRYLKFGKGHLWHCWKPRIVRDYSVREGNLVKCQCGNVIGFDVGIYIKLRQKSFTW
ncbi:MAG: hypothetical protein J7L98_07335 [Candidatus Verstraetearchaeota archaeon]|nr:hypothetical protein [Candidatus Verstraetearchaeota archaeon]